MRGTKTPIDFSRRLIPPSLTLRLSNKTNLPYSNKQCSELALKKGCLRINQETVKKSKKFTERWWHRKMKRAHSNSTIDNCINKNIYKF